VVYLKNEKTRYPFYPYVGCPQVPLGSYGSKSIVDLQSKKR
jgi:hypothetical protein